MVDIDPQLEVHSNDETSHARDHAARKYDVQPDARDSRIEVRAGSLHFAQDAPRCPEDGSTLGWVVGTTDLKAACGPPLRRPNTATQP